MRVHQVLCAAGPHDAITTQALAYRRLFGGWGWGGDDHSAVIDPALDAGIRPLAGLQADRDDVLLIHYSGHVRELDELVRRDGRTLLVYHNITPAKWFWEYDPGVAVGCALGRDQLERLARAVDLAAGVSEYNTRELRKAGARETAVIPILFDRSRLPERAGPPASRPTVLFVGRLAPHKRQDAVIRAFALYRRHRRPDARLVLVGVPVSPKFGAAIERLAGELAPGAVEVEQGVSRERLFDHYSDAHAFLCLSEHEGFCIPLLEAFHFGVPVIARPEAGVPETVGDAALLASDPDLAVIAELLELVVEDGELRADLRRRGEARLADYAPERTAGLIRAAVEGESSGS